MNNREWADGRWGGGTPVVAGEAMDDWVTILRASRPWSEMWLDDVGGEFRAVLEELLHTDDERAPDLRAKRLRTVARAHGAFRRRQGCPAVVLSDEVAFAEAAIGAAFARSGATPALVASIQDSLAPVMRAVERASYSGYVDWGDRPQAET